MKLSTKGSSSLEALLCMAAYFPDTPVKIRDISERTAISEPYLKQLFHRLRKTGVLSAVRGAGGGYYIAGNAAELTVGDIVRAAEGELIPVPCVKDVNNCTGAVRKVCAARNLWLRIAGGIEAILNQTTLHELARAYLAEVRQ